MAAAEAAGFEAIAAPLLRIVPLPWSMPAEQPDALLFTSARAPAVLAEAAPVLRAIPAYAVGPHTAEAARNAGFDIVGTGAGDGTATVAMAARDGRHRLLHLAGAATAPLEVPAGLTVDRAAVYAAEAMASLPEQARDGDLLAATLFSVRTAQIFVRLLERARIDRETVRLVAISAKVADAAGEGWRALAVADVPTLDAVMEAARRLWQGCSHG